MSQNAAAGNAEPLVTTVVDLTLRPRALELTKERGEILEQKGYRLTRLKRKQVGFAAPYAKSVCHVVPGRMAGGDGSGQQPGAGAGDMRQFRGLIRILDMLCVIVILLVIGYFAVVGIACFGC